MEMGRISTAMISSFSTEGKIDYEIAGVLIEHLIKNGTNSIVVNGTTGESPTLSVEEKEALLAFTIKTVNKRIPVIAGTGTNSTSESLQLTKKATELGADGIMLVTPYYNKPSQKGMYAHFTEIASETSLPILLYNIPGRSVVNLLPETVVALSKVKNIRAVKEASGDLEQIATIITETDQNFSVYSGDDALTLPILAIGGNGIVSVAAHIVGNDMQKMIAAFLAGRNAEAAAMHRALLPLFRGLFATSNPVPLKYALKKMNIGTGGVRLPLISYGDCNAEFDHIWKEYEKNRTLFA
ncbi:4-hydroxy-tetrahydrodipicolinate synthase [Sporosarcina siberiensis]|uniref:4-hydroxy-tetrahydrodipicolinate synthase n=1 Tax=Sporosarcina siberiensis TaxID=1365606 RepID=A0ABW4SJP9_9BACL